MATITRRFKIGLSKADIENIKDELGQIEVDTSLNPTSENPIANKTVAQNFSQVNTDIAAINAAQNLLDIVATYIMGEDSLFNYPKANLKDNDKIKVLNDETHENQATYYRYNAASSTWIFIAEEPVPKIEVADEITEGSEELVTAGLVFDFVNDKIEEEITSALSEDYVIGGE